MRNPPTGDLRVGATLRRWIARGRREAILGASAWLVAVALCVAVAGFGLGIAGVFVEMNGGDPWVLEGAFATFSVAGTIGGVISALAVVLMLAWRGDHGHGWPTVLLMLLGLATGVLALAWIWSEYIT